MLPRAKRGPCGLKPMSKDVARPITDDYIDTGALNIPRVATKDDLAVIYQHTGEVTGVEQSSAKKEPLIKNRCSENGAAIYYECQIRRSPS